MSKYSIFFDVYIYCIDVDCVVLFGQDKTAVSWH